MDNPEFASIMAYISLGCGKPLSRDAQAVYFDLLGDLPAAALKTAAQRVLLEHRWATFPMVAELREAATDTLRGQAKELSPAEAWALAWRAAGRIDPEQQGSVERGLADLPPLVIEAMQAFGIPALCYGQEPVGVVRGQFLKMFEQFAARERRLSLMPAVLRQAIAKASGHNLAEPVVKALALIGKAGEE